MLKKTLSLSFALIALASFGQQVTHRCMTTHAMDYQESVVPGYKASVAQAFEDAKKTKLPTQVEKNSYIYTIPVVVHVVFNTPEQNIPDSVIYNQIASLNADYQRLNADTSNMRTDFEPVKGSPQIRFVLASSDPNGQFTSGITRTQTSTTSFGSFALLGGDFSDLEKVKSTTNGGIDPWDQAHYLNIWVCNMAINFGGSELPMLLGYATPPDNLPNWPPGSNPGLEDGVVIQYQAFGSNNPNSLDLGQGPIEVLGRTASHEVGHYLGLRHIWGDGDCTEHDGIDDTPNADAQSDQDCNTTKNTCVDDIGGVDLPDMVENFMDYSAESCQNSWTQGQVELIHGVLENQRYDLVHDNNVGISKTSLMDVVVYPNPFSDDIALQFDSGISTVEVYASNGQQLMRFENYVSGSQLSLAELRAGIYFLKVIGSESESSLMKVTKY